MVHVRHRERERMESIEDPQVVSQIVNDILKINTNIKYDQICIKWYTIFVASHLDSWLTLSILSASRVFHRMVGTIEWCCYFRGITDWYPSLAGHWWFWWRQWFGHHRASGCVPWRRQEYVYHIENQKRRDGLYTKCKIWDLIVMSHALWMFRLNHF